MSQPRSNSRRFINAAWSLLTFQLIASAGAVAVTGVAAFYVSGLASGWRETAGPVDAAVEMIDGGTAPSEATPTPVPETATLAPQTPDVPAGPVNDGAGLLALTADERGNINASLQDADGLSGAPRIEWFRNGQIVANAAGPMYTIRPEDSQAAITARATYVDGDGFSESAVSQPFQVGVIIP